MDVYTFLPAPAFRIMAKTRNKSYTVIFFIYFLANVCYNIFLGREIALPLL